MPKTEKPTKADAYKAFVKTALKKGKTRMQAAQMLSAKYEDLSLNYIRTMVYKMFPDEPHAGPKRVAWNGAGRATKPVKKAPAKPKAKPKAIAKKLAPSSKPTSMKAKSLGDVTAEVVVHHPGA